jgi:hypothetical protein
MTNSGAIPEESSHSGAIPVESGHSCGFRCHSGGITGFRMESVGHCKVGLCTVPVATGSTGGFYG